MQTMVCEARAPPRDCAEPSRVGLLANRHFELGAKFWIFGFASSRSSSNLRLLREKLQPGAGCIPDALAEITHPTTYQKPRTPHPTTATMPTAEQKTRDYDCAVFARAALFPGRMHRDGAHPHHFPALAVLEAYRQRLLASSSHPSSLFPRGVILVRNLGGAEGQLQWNGAPEIDKQSASFEVIPHRLSVRCTSECDQYTQQMKQTALLLETKNDKIDNNNSDTTTVEDGETVLVLCTDRLLPSRGSDYREPLDAAIAQELPPRAYRKIEEAVAHQVAKIAAAAPSSSGSSTATGTSEDDNNIAAAAHLELEAAKAAECYYSGRHRYDNKHMPTVKRGSQLPRGYGWMPGVLQNYLHRQCLLKVAAEQLSWQQQPNDGEGSSSPMSRRQARAAVQEAMK